VRYIDRFTSETRRLMNAGVGSEIRAWARQRLIAKYSGMFPRIFTTLVNQFLTPRPASTYRFAVQALGLAGSGTATLTT
jgi:hypothetical protein